MLDLLTHIPKPLRRNVLSTETVLGLTRQIPWKDWVGRPLAYIVSFAGVSVLLQQFLLSHQSPFSRWLGEHVEIRQNKQSSVIGKSLPYQGQVLYVKDTGNESADASIGKALRVLSNFGLIKASVIHQDKQKAETIEERIP